MRERNKAIRKAWEREQQLVQEGKGTRDWTKEQQADILDPDKGKAYDDQGRAFEGQHMKSAAEYPEYQGDPDNIQFLTKDEHLAAHKGSWQNPTNWYYDPVTKEFTDFGLNEPTPCKAIPLTDPIRIPDTATSNESDQDDTSKPATSKDIEQKQIPRNEGACDSEKYVPHERANPLESSVVHESFGDKISHVVDAVKDFGAAHPILTKVLKWGGVAALTAGSAYVASKSNGSGNSGSSDNEDDDFLPITDKSTDYNAPSEDQEDDDSSAARDYPDERSSPREHDVSGYDRQQNGKTVHVNPYKRGGKHDD